jgi:hypothetical protein
MLHHNYVLSTSVFPDERQRVQLDLITKLSAYTGARPGSVVYQERNCKVLGSEDEDPDEEDPDAMDIDIEEIFECLCYKHVTLFLLRNPGGERDLLGMEVDLRFTKGHKRKFKRQVS